MRATYTEETNMAISWLTRNGSLDRVARTVLVPTDEGRTLAQAICARHIRLPERIAQAFETAIRLGFAVWWHHELYGGPADQHINENYQAFTDM